MSSILKALEKAEQSRNARLPGGVNGFVTKRERRPPWVVPAGVLGGAAVAVLVTFTAMGGFSRHALPVTRANAPATHAPVPLSPPHPMTELPAARPEEMLQLEPEDAVAVPKPKAPPAPSLALPRKSGRAVATLPVAHPATARSVAAQAAPVRVTALPAATPQAAPVKAHPQIRVTGIAWQKGGESSAAIVNGRSVQKGGMVEGLKVEEIFQDRVRFSGSNGNLEVPL